MKKLVMISSIVIIAIVFSFCIMGSKASSENKPDETARTKYYTSYQIQTGDTLTSIANMYITEEYDSVKEYIDEVHKINGFVGDKIYAGAYLMLPYYAD